MGKAILVVRMPKSCSECNFCKKMEDSCDYCMVSNKIIVDVSLKKFSCPLKPMPENKDAMTAHFATDYNYAVGWNDCLDAIQGKE